MKTKAIEDAAREYSKSKGFSANKDTYHGEGFLAGDAHGYARAIEQASYGYIEWATNNLSIGYGDDSTFSEHGETWQSAKLSAQKELDFKTELVNQRDVLIDGLQKEIDSRDERIKELEKEFNDLKMKNDNREIFYDEYIGAYADAEDFIKQIGEMK